MRGRSNAIRAIAHRHESAGIAHHRHPDFDMADADAVVDHLAGASLAVPGVDVGRTELELERSRHAVEGIEAICLGRLAVGVDVDEPRCDDEPPRIDRISAANLFGSDYGDSPVVERDIANRIEVRCRIDHASAENDVVVDSVRFILRR
jgi:hypothetical protein